MHNVKDKQKTLIQFLKLFFLIAQDLMTWFNQNPKPRIGNLFFDLYLLRLKPQIWLIDPFLNSLKTF